MDTNTILHRGLSILSFDITYRAYVPYDDPSGRDLLTLISEFLPRWFPTLRIFLLLMLCPFSSSSTKMVHTERRNLVAHGFVPYCPMLNPILKKKKNAT